MLCRRCGKNNALVEDGLCARCSDEAFGSLTAPPGAGADRAEPLAPLPPPVPSAPYDPRARWALLRSPNGLATLAMALLGLVLVVDLGAVGVGIAEYRALSDLVGGGWAGFDDGKFGRLDDAYRFLGVAQTGALVVTAIGFILWFLRVRDNAEIFAPQGQSKARPWAVFGFFVPVVAFWFPRRIALDTWHASADGLELSRKRARSGVIELWWFLWILNQVFGRFAGRQYDKAESLTEIESATAWVIAGDVLDIVSAAAAIWFVRSLTRLQNRKVTAGGVPATVIA
ncbi:DUF4328 domain-containing protein [Streptomyces sp. NPDC016845]|uniref:DUF4328 domain-containing protein n=1 Tax=Streptomyces sp. NPDC016845 TaxID=3364972 RepID=UPI0037A03C98